MMNLTKSELAELPGAIYEGIRSLANRQPLEGIAKAVSEANQSVLIRQGLISNSPFEMYIDLDTLNRAALQVGVFGSGGAFIPTSTSSDVEPVLRATCVCEKAGAVVLSNLSGNVEI